MSLPRWTVEDRDIRKFVGAFGWTDRLRQNRLPAAQCVGHALPTTRDDHEIDVFFASQVTTRVYVVTSNEA
jgi:hypothetical protein